MLPKRFLVDDMCRELGVLAAALADTRKRLDRTQRQNESMRRAIEALRKRVSRQAATRRARPAAARWQACSRTKTMP